MDTRRLNRTAEARQFLRRVFSLRVPASALFAALMFTQTFGASAAWANDLAVIRKGLSSAAIVDVRTEREFSGGALDGALNHPLQGLPTTLLDIGVDPDKEIIVYCRSGRRSAKAKILLKAAGFKLVFDGGAMEALEEALKEAKS